MEDENKIVRYEAPSTDYQITIRGGGKNREIRISAGLFNFGIMSAIIGIFLFIGACGYSVYSALHYRQNVAAVTEARKAAEMQQEQLLSVSKKASALSETLQNLAQQEEELRIQAGVDKPAREDKVDDEDLSFDFDGQWKPPTDETPAEENPAEETPAEENPPAPEIPAAVENPAPQPQSEWTPPAPEIPAAVENPAPQPQSQWKPPANRGQGGPTEPLKVDDVSEALAMLEQRVNIRADSLNDFQNELKIQREQMSFFAAVPTNSPEMLVIDEGFVFNPSVTFDLSSFGGNPSVNPNMPSIWPTNGIVSSPYGLRWGGTDFHPGIDIANDMGTPIVATADGVVEYAGWNSGGYGNMVDINHGNGLMTRYGHASQVVVTVGQYVKRGQLIAYMGSTGFSTGPHVHYEVHVNGQRVNPISYL